MRAPDQAARGAHPLADDDSDARRIRSSNRGATRRAGGNGALQHFEAFANVEGRRARGDQAPGPKHPLLHRDRASFKSRWENVGSGLLRHPI